MAHKLLLADDSITIQRVIELTFAEEDVNVLAVGDGKHAIDRIQTERPDIVLADVGMPEQDGYEVAAFVKGNPQLAHIPVLLLTGAFEPIDENRARTVGCDGVLVKPFEPQMVINRVKDLLAGKKPAGSNNATPEQPRPVVTTSGQESYVPRATNQSDSLEEYFDRLDAAFANLNHEPDGSAAPAVTAPPAPPTPAIEASTASADVDSWDPDLTAAVNQPALRAPIPLVPAAPIPLVQSPAPIPLVHDEPAPYVAPPFEPLPFAPPPAASAAPEPALSLAPAPVVAAIAPTASLAPVSLAEAFATLLAAEHGQAIAPIPLRTNAAPAPAVVDDIVRQVLDRLQQDDMRHAVLDAAERLVREEIDRIKRNNG